jgi:outer membrane protein TolC
MKRICAFAVVLLLLMGFLFQNATAAESVVPKNLSLAVAAACAADTTISSEKLQLTSKSPVDSSGNPTTHDLLKAQYINNVNQKALTVAIDLIDLDYSKTKYNYLLKQKTALAAELKKIQTEFQIGAAQSSDVDNIQKEVNRNSLDLTTYQMLIKTNQQVYTALTGYSIPSDFDFSSCYFIMDVAKIPSPLPNVTATDAGVSAQLNDAIEKYGKLGDAIGTYIQDSETLTDTQNNFKIGAVDQTAVDTATDAANSAEIEALECKADYSKALYNLDCSLDGYLSKNIKKPTDGSIFLSPSDVD